MCPFVVPFRFIAVCLLMLLPTYAIGQDCRNGQCPTPVRSTLKAVGSVILPSQRVSAIDVSGFDLAPGETLVAINGVPLAGWTTTAHTEVPDIAWETTTAVTTTTDLSGFNLQPGETLIAVNGVSVATPLRNLLSLPGRMVGAVVNSDARAFAHAQREANLQAQRGRYGHVLGTAPGCSFSGVGTSFSVNSPNHCTTNRTLVARAYAVGSNSKVYWSAHYR